MRFNVDSNGNCQYLKTTVLSTTLASRSMALWISTWDLSSTQSFFSVRIYMLHSLSLVVAGLQMPILCTRSYVTRLALLPITNDRWTHLTGFSRPRHTMALGFIQQISR